jgi:hypothetical protein
VWVCQAVRAQGANRTVWEQIADNTVAILRGAAGRDPFDEKLTNLIGELSTRSEDFEVDGGARRASAPHRRKAPAPPGGR